MLNAVILSIVMLIAIIPSVVILYVALLSIVTHCVNKLDDNVLNAIILNVFVLSVGQN
jgi:hypothetical protein